MSEARRTECAFKFNGKSVTVYLQDYLENVSYTDVASGSSDSLDITVHNIDKQWMDNWYPVKGDKVVGSFLFKNWVKDQEDIILPLGIFTLDEITLRGGPLTANFGCVAVPNDQSFRVRERTKTWSDVTLKEIGEEIATRYGLLFTYDCAESIQVKKLEQSDETDCSFLYSLCENNGLKMKVYAGAITIYDQSEFEQKKSVATLTRESFDGDSWNYADTIAGIYTGARISYKSEGSDEEISVYVGFQAEDAEGSRILKVSQTADSQGDAYRKAAAAVNESNEEATTLKGDIFPDPNICAGVCVKVRGMGKIDGKYFVEKSTISVSDGKTSQSLEMHKCQPRLNYTPKPAAGSGEPASSHNIGDVVQFAGGKHYVSSYAGAKGYNAKPGPAKITAMNEKGAHPYHLIHTDKTSNVYGWVDEGTFS